MNAEERRSVYHLGGGSPASHRIASWRDPATSRIGPTTPGRAGRLPGGERPGTGLRQPEAHQAGKNLHTHSLALGEDGSPH